VGDLENAAAYEAFREAIDRLEQLVGVRPEVVACDLHPGYLSTRYARERCARRLVAVQHHHAHVAAALAEHGLAGPALGLAWDGTGLGSDGAAWGGELLRVEGGDCERLATFRPVALAGGDARSASRGGGAGLLGAPSTGAPQRSCSSACRAATH
jgi:hydrogenase maturation protein HypF